MIGLSTLASGSSGNAIYVGTPKTKLLIDAGISFREISRRLFALGVEISDIDGVIISHEHLDHIRGLDMITKKLDLPLFANKETADFLYRSLRTTPNFRIFPNNDGFQLSDLEVYAFDVRHDAVHPVGFSLKYKGIKVGICTDIGFVTRIVEIALEGSDYLVIESNHDKGMVNASKRSQIYKDRVLGPYGHLSNDECGQLLSSIATATLKKVVLAHISKECNETNIAISTVRKYIKDSNTEIVAASQDVVGDPILFES